MHSGVGGGRFLKELFVQLNSVCYFSKVIFKNARFALRLTGSPDFHGRTSAGLNGFVLFSRSCM